jgi:hypothetical protein
MVLLLQIYRAIRLFCVQLWRWRWSEHESAHRLAAQFDQSYDEPLLSKRGRRDLLPRVERVLEITALRMFTFLSLFALLALVWSVLWFPWQALKWLSEHLVESRPLSKRAKQLLLAHRSADENDFAHLLDLIRVVPNTSLLSKVLTYRDDCAVMVETLLVVGPASDSEMLGDGREDVGTVAHELVHAAQFDRLGGFVPFLSTYFALQLLYTMHCLRRGASLGDAWALGYNRNLLELQAYCFEATFAKLLASGDNDDGGGDY